MPRKSDRRNCGFFLFGADWRAEPTLALVSEGARLLWMEMLMLMAECDERGFLLVNGRRPTPAQIAVLTRTDPEKVVDRLRELEENGVFNRDRRGVVYSRRMVQDEKTSRKNKENGMQGGNPTLCRTTQKNGPVNPSDNGSVKALTLTPSSNPNPNPKTNPEETESLTTPEAVPAVVEEAPPPPVGGAADVAASAMWNLGVTLLGPRGRPMIGKWCKLWGRGAVFDVLLACAEHKPADPIPWIQAALQARAGERLNDKSPMAIHRRVVERFNRVRSEEEIRAEQIEREAVLEYLQ